MEGHEQSMDMGAVGSCLGFIDALKSGVTVVGTWSADTGCRGPVPFHLPETLFARSWAPFGRS